MLLPTLLPFLTLATAVPLSAPLPVVIWHGLGDRFDADGLRDVADLIQEVHPGTYVHIIGLGDDGGADRQATFLGNTTAQSDDVCAQLSADPLLSAASTRIDALGFSQGGLFLRGLVERCPGIDVRSLVTFGSPHNGISSLPACGEWDLLCKGTVAAFERSKWSEWVQSNLVPAQYYRELNETTGLGTDDYVEHSGFLAGVNNEGESKNRLYKKRLASLDHLALYMFSDDTTLRPKETAWFADVNGTTQEVVELKDRVMYKEDWIGLRELDAKGALEFRTIEGGHMQLKEKVLVKAFKEFFGPEESFVPLSLQRVWSNTRSFLGKSWFLG